jgi:hypothetical protein
MYRNDMCEAGHTTCDSGCIGPADVNRHRGACGVVVRPHERTDPSALLGRTAGLALAHKVESGLQRRSELSK